MIPAGYMAKRVSKKPEQLEVPDSVTDIYSVSSCISENFADYINYWKHNGYWFFDSPGIIERLAASTSIDLEGTTLFYYETSEVEFDGSTWNLYVPEPSFSTNVLLPSNKQLEGFDVVTFWAKTSPECSPLSCNALAMQLHTNAHCLLASFAEAETYINNGAFSGSEPGPFRIFAVYSTDWTEKG